MPTNKTNSTNTKKSKNVNIRLSSQEYNHLKELAGSANMSISGYLRKSALSGNRISVVPNGKDILPHLTKLSNYVNIIEEPALKQEMQKEVKIIWQYLSM